jgi:hypothetical protein
VSKIAFIILLILGVDPAHTFGETIVAYDEHELPITPDHFDIEVEWDGAESIPMFIRFSRNSLIWKRQQNGNKFPQLTLSLNMKEQDDIQLSYQGRTFVPERKENAHIAIDVDVFTNEPVKIGRAGKLLGRIAVKPMPEIRAQHFVYIDPSCLPYFVQLDNPVDFYSSLSCEFHPNKDRKGVLNVAFAPAESRLAGKFEPPYTVQLSGDAQARLRLALRDEVHEISIRAKVPEYVARFKSALGFGPYRFLTARGGDERAYHTAMSYMLYARYDLTESTSLRFFDALIDSGGFFNNAGGYFAYNAGSTDDGRIAVFPLLGFQGISFRNHKSDPLFQQIIFPQGFEVVYRHAFGLHNYHLIGGMFLSTASTGAYENAWLRFGRKYFWELNWISWSYLERRSHSFGLSVGIPILSL